MGPIGENPGMKMNPELKAKWVEALRSGQYQQGSYHLRSEKDEYCCLGVLCAIFPGVTWELRTLPDKGSVYTAKVSPTELYPDGSIALSSYTYLPRRISEEVGISQMEQQTLGRANDIEQLSFAEIATYIEGKL